MIEFEKRNPLQLDKPKLVHDRILFTYKQALLSLRFYGPVWFEAGAFAHENGYADEASEFFTRGCEANPDRYGVYSTFTIISLGLFRLGSHEYNSVYSSTLPVQILPLVKFQRKKVSRWITVLLTFNVSLRA